MPDSPPPDQPNRRPLLWLAFGAALGLLIATTGLLRSSDSGTETLPEGVVARVNAGVILREDYERLLAGLDSDTRAPIDAAARHRVLDRMIEEELLVQRGLELGLATSDRKIRGDLVSALIRSVVVEAEDREPSRAELERFFADERGFFTQPGRLHVDQIFFRVRSPGEDSAAAARAAAALARLESGEPFERVREEDGDAVISAIPSALLPAAKLREYVGPTALRAAMDLSIGAPSRPVRSGTGYHLLRVVEREPPRSPELSAIEAQIRAEWRRRSGDQALRDYLDELRDQATVVTSPP